MSHIKDAAACLGISVNTVRMHLERVTLKTGASRQSDLVRMVLRGPGPLVPRASGAAPLRVSRRGR